MSKLRLKSYYNPPPPLHFSLSLSLSLSQSLIYISSLSFSLRPSPLSRFSPFFLHPSLAISLNPSHLYFSPPLSFISISLSHSHYLSLSLSLCLFLSFFRLQGLKPTKIPTMYNSTHTLVHVSCAREKGDKLVLGIYGKHIDCGRYNHGVTSLGSVSQNLISTTSYKLLL